MTPKILLWNELHEKGIFLNDSLQIKLQPSSEEQLQNLYFYPEGHREAASAAIKLLKICF